MLPFFLLLRAIFFLLLHLFANICLTPLVFMGSRSVGNPFLPSGNLLSHLPGLRGWESPIVLSASRRIVALLGNAVVSGRE